jgi:uncharacterized protein YggE
MIFALTMLLAVAQTGGGPALPQPPQLVVTGNANVLATPDEAVVRLGIVRQANEAQTAQEQANAVAQDILGAVAKLGVPAKDIQTARLVLTPVYTRRGSETKIDSYNANNTVSIRLDKLDMVGGVIDAGLKAGANELEGVQFQLRNDLPTRELALKEAVQEARAKAQTMADALHVNLAEVVEASESGVSVVPRVQAMESVRAMSVQGATPTPVSPGQLEVRAGVTIRYRITPKP